MSGFSYDQLLDLISTNINDCGKNIICCSFWTTCLWKKYNIRKIYQRSYCKGIQSSVLQMDGFHYDDQILKEKESSFKGSQKLLILWV